MRLHAHSIWQAGRQRLGSIRGRLTLWYVVVLAFTLVGYSAILVVSLARGLDSGVDRVLSDAARQATGVLQAVGSDQELREEFRRINVGTVVGLYDQNGDRFLAEPFNERWTTRCLSPDLRPAWTPSHYLMEPPAQ